MTNLQDYTLLTKKRTEYSNNEKATSVYFYETFLAPAGEINYLSIGDTTSEEFKAWVINRPRVWFLTKYLKEESASRGIEKKRHRWS